MLDGFRSLGVKSDSESHAIKSPGLERNLQFLALYDIFILEHQSGILVLISLESPRHLSVRLYVPVHGLNIRQRTYPSGIDIVKYHHVLHGLGVGHAGIGIYIRCPRWEHEPLLHDTVDYGLLIYRTIVGRDVSGTSEHVYTCCVSTLAIVTGHGGSLHAQLDLDGVTELATPEMDNILGYPAVAIPLVLGGHREKGVQKVDIVIRHQHGLVLDRVVYIKVIIDAVIRISVSFKVTQEHAQLRVKSGGKVPSCLLSMIFRGILEYLRVPLIVISVQP